MRSAKQLVMQSSVAFVLLGLIALIAVADATVSVSPPQLAASRLHTSDEATAALVLVNITFESTNPQDDDFVDFSRLAFPIDFEVQVAVVENRDHAFPYGFGNLQSSICRPRVRNNRGCVYADGPRHAVIELRPSSLFDVKMAQVVRVRFGTRLFSVKRTSPLDVFFTIEPTANDPVVLSYALQAPLIITDVITALVMPSTQDLASLAMIPSMTCATNAQEDWTVIGLFVYLPLGSADVFDSAAVIIGTMCALVLLCWGITVAMRGADATPEAKVAFRTLFPLVLAQLWFYFAARGLSFAAGQLMGASYPRYQVFGGFIQIILCFSFIGSRQLLLCDPKWEWCRAPAETKIATTLGERWGSFQRLTGHWFFDYGGPPSVQKTWAPRIFPREFDAGVRLRVVLPLLWLWNNLLVTVLGGSPETPSGCFAHYVGTGLAQLVVCVFIVRFRAYRSYVLVVLTVAIRCLTAIALFLLSSGPNTGSMGEPTYFFCVGSALVIAWARLAWWAYSWATETPPEVRRAGVQADEPGRDASDDEKGSPLLEVVAPIADETPSSPLQENDDRKNVRFFPVSETPPPASPSAATVETPAVMMSNASLVSNVSALTLAEGGSASFGGAVGALAREPEWLLDASKTRLKAMPDDVLRDKQPLWFPEERPHVRRDNVPDLPLKFSPYLVRNKSSRAPPE